LIEDKRLLVETKINCIDAMSKEISKLLANHQLKDAHILVYQSTLPSFSVKEFLTLIGLGHRNTKGILIVVLDMVIYAGRIFYGSRKLD